MSQSEEMSSRKRVRDDSSESEFNSPEVKRLREDLLGNLDDSDLCTTSPDLDSFMKTFEEEISALPPAAVIDLTSESGESQPDLGYLLGASDDELGLPPTNNATSSSPIEDEVNELVRLPPDSSAELDELWRFGDEIPSYDSFGFEFAGNDGNYAGDNNEDFVQLDGLFDYSDLGFGSGDAPVHSWRPETMPAL